MAKKRTTGRAARAPDPPAGGPPGLRLRNQGIRRIRLAELHDNPANFRIHDPSQRAAFTATIDEIGWFSYPDVFELPDGSGYMLVDGELRADVLRTKYGADAEVDVNVTDFDAQEAQKALATKDPITAMAIVDRQKLAELLRDMDKDNVAFGELILSLAQQERIDLDPLPADFWQQGELPEPTPKLTAEYGVAPGGCFFAEGRARHTLVCLPADAVVVQGLLREVEPLLLISQIPACGFDPAVLAAFNGPVSYTFYDPADPAGVAELAKGLADATFAIRCQLIWQRELTEPTRNGFVHNYDVCFYGVREGRAAKWNGSRTESTVSDCTHPVDGALPLEYPGRIMKNHGTADDMVFDPWAGLGSVAVAAERLGRPSISIEANEQRLAVCLERLAGEGATISREESTSCNG